MAHFAKLDQNNKVIEVHCVSNDVLDSSNEEASGIAFLIEWSGGYTNWKQTSYNNNFRKRYAGVDYTYDETNDVFIEPQPFPSWSLDDDFNWQAPKPKPEGFFIWDENQFEWINGQTL